MIFTKNVTIIVSIFITASILSCKKSSADEEKNPLPNYTPKHIVYQVEGTSFRLNFIDSNNVFQRDQIFQGSFRYEFDKGPGTQIGISIYLASPTDTIRGWYIYINNKLYANAFSEGGAYLTVPYD